MGLSSRPSENPSLISGKWGDKFKVYLVIECCIWLPACYLFCYRFKPTIRITRTEPGRRIVHAAGGFLERYAPTTHRKLTALAEKAQGAPAGRAAAEWALINKVRASLAERQHVQFSAIASGWTWLCGGVSPVAAS